MGVPWDKDHMEGASEGYETLEGGEGCCLHRRLIGHPT